MRDKKKMIIVGAIVLIIIVLVAVFVCVKKGSDKNDEMSSIEEFDKNGIYYGGNFDEFKYRDKEDEETVEAETEPVDLDEIASEMQKIEEEYKKNRKGDILKEEELENNNNVSEEKVELLSENEQEETDVKAETEEDIEENIEEIEISADDLGMICSSGYAENEVLCDAMSQEEAESIAKQINGTVLSCQNGTATIQIEENVDDLLERLEQQGSSLELYRNYNVFIQ